MLKQLFYATILGIVASIFLLQRDEAVKIAVGNQLEELLSHAFDCSLRFEIDSMNLFTGKIIAHNVTTNPNDHADWHWSSKKAIAQFSLWDLVTYRKVGLHLTFQELSAHTSITNNTIAIIPHLQATMIGFSPDVPLLLDGITFQQSHVNFVDSVKGHHAALDWESNLHFTADKLQGSFAIANGTGVYANKQYCNALRGSLTLELPYNITQPWSIITDLNAHITLLDKPDTNCSCSGSITNQKGIFTIKTSDNQIIIEPLIIDLTSKETLASATMHIPIEQIITLLGKKDSLPLAGNCTVTAQYQQHETGSAIEGTIRGSALQYQGVTALDKCTINFSLNNAKVHGTFHARAQSLSVRGTGEFDLVQHTGSVTLWNSKEIPIAQLPDWSIAPEKAHISLSIDRNYRLTGNYTTLINNRSMQTPMKLAGAIRCNTHEFTIAGSADQAQYASTIVLKPALGIKEFVFKNGHGEELIALQSNNTDCRRFTGHITVPCINTITQLLGNVAVAGQGTLQLCGVIKPDSLLIKTEMKKGTIRLPQNYNCIKGLDATLSLNLPRKELVIHNLNAQLYEGSCRSRRAIITLNDQWQLARLQLPLIIDHCLFNIKKDLFAEVSGNLLIDKGEGNIPAVKGHLMVNHAQLNDNIFSAAFHEIIAQYTHQTVAAPGLDIACDLTIETERPIRIKNAFFDTQAVLDVAATGNLGAPILSGTISLNGGSLLFPYKPLMITKAILSFNNQNLNDPIIEVIAKNNIKKYLVTLTARGSLKHHQIAFSSNPPLGEEQILGLLLLGFEELSLSSAAPALVMNNVTNLLFGSNPESLLQRALAALPEPFKRVRFIPSVADPSGRGGLRGNLEIDINDRWHASIQKNFNLSEDTRFELEYLLSDEISLKGIRDEHRDASGEVEMRFKF